MKSYIEEEIKELSESFADKIIPILPMPRFEWVEFANTEIRAMAEAYADDMMKICQTQSRDAWIQDALKQFRAAYKLGVKHDT